MRTLQWYDVTWTKTDGSPATEIAVNEDVIVQGKFRAIEDWPKNVPPLDMAFLSTAGPSSVFVKMESYIDEVPMIQSTQLEFRREYEFKLVMRGRIPGNFHLHPTVMVQGGGPIIGPGAWVNITGAWEDFSLPLTTLTGEEIDNLETWGVSTVVTWHLLWIAVAAFWLLWWLRRPLLTPRFIANKKGGNEDILITRSDQLAGVILLVGTIAAVVVGNQWANSKFPQTSPLQGSVMKLPSAPPVEELVTAFIREADYDVPGRTMRFDVELTNNAERPVQIGEFGTASIRFLNPDVAAATQNIHESFPRVLVNYGLSVNNNEPLQPGETRIISVKASDAAWETERLADLVKDPVNRFAGLLMFYDDLGTRHITEVSGAVVSVFVPISEDRLAAAD
uniref:Putative ethylene monooxygenase protein B n=1 Tax=Haliea sp. ETY-NAG TaxID=1055106 RepID=J7M3X7_9GAMM|nr:putative ethylene monooxygenase protein B [Haliea sp. ETY-NAG]